MFNASLGNSTTFNGSSGSQTPGTHWTKTISDIISYVDYLITRLNGQRTGLWTRVAKAPRTGITRVPKDSPDYTFGEH